MSDAKDYLVQHTEQGSVNISEDALATIATKAVCEVEGVYGLASSITAEIAERLKLKNSNKSIRLTLNDDAVTVDCYIDILYGYEIPVVAKSIQENIISSIESMTGLSVAAVNIAICGIFDVPAAEPET